MFVNPYELLGVTPNASAAAIHKAWLSLARRYHPDRNPDDPLVKILFNQITAAWRFLGDAQSRQQYDSRQVFLKKNKDGHLKVIEIGPLMPLKPDFFLQPAAMMQSSLLPVGSGVYQPPGVEPFCPSFFNFDYLKQLTGMERPLKKRVILALDATIAEIYSETPLPDKHQCFIKQWLSKFSPFFNVLNYLDNHQQLQQLHSYLTSPSLDKLNPVKKLFKLNLLCAMLDCPVSEADYSFHLSELEIVWGDYLVHDCLNAELK